MPRYILEWASMSLWVIQTMSSGGDSAEFEQVFDLEHERVARFNALITQELPIHCITPEVNFSVSDPLHSAIREIRGLGIQRGLLFDLATIRSITYEGSEVPKAIVEFVPRVSRGKKSAHGVFFGDIVFDNDRTLEVAVKPFTDENNEWGALYDQLSNYAVRKLGLYTLEPAGVLLDGNGEHGTSYSMTVLEEGMTTFDSIDWTDFADAMEENPGMTELWSSLARTVAVLHASGQSNQGDLAGRNIATSDDGGAFLIDWEKARFSGNAPRDADTRYQFSSVDLTQLVESMCRTPDDPLMPGIGIFKLDKPDWWKQFCTIFYDDYLDTRKLLAEEGSHHKATVVDVNSELTALTDKLKSEMQKQRKVIENATLRTAA